MTGKTYEEIYGKDKADELKRSRKKTSKERIVSQETKEKMSNVIHTKKWNDKISKSKTGIKNSQEANKKISEYMSNPDKNPNVDQTLYIFYHKEFGEIVARKYDMKKKYDCKTIHRVVSGVNKHSRG